MVYCLAWTAMAEDYIAFIVLGVPHHYIYIPPDIHLPKFHITAPILYEMFHLLRRPDS